MITVFTPTHNVQWLARVEASLAKQIFHDFEWLVVPNGPVRSDNVKLTLPQARVLGYVGKTQNIGELKRFCCDNAKGDILVELDHDDELTPNALAEIVKSFQNAKIDFVYSNCIEIKDEKPFTFSRTFGWESKVLADGQIETIAFAPTPASFSKIWYAPNHVRAWRKRFYDQIGGHNKSLDILDDHDLLCRTYIHGNVFHINLPLYIYHSHTQSTCRGLQNTKIQEETLNIHDQYVEQLVCKWCKLNNLLAVDLCCGKNPRQGYLGVDKMYGCDLDNTWPFANNSVGVFRAHDALEHLKNPINTMKEIYRCLAPNGWLLSQTPSTDGRGAFQDPTHVSFWNSNSFWYYTKKAQNQFIDCPVRFQLNRVKNFYPDVFCKTHNITYVKADLLKFSGRTPGLLEI